MKALLTTLLLIPLAACSLTGWSLSPAQQTQFRNACLNVEIATSVIEGTSYGQKASVKKTIAAGRAMCAAQPSDLPSALMTLALIYTELTRVQEKVVE